MAPLGPASLLVHAAAPGAARLAPLDVMRRGGDALLLDSLVALEPEVIGLSVAVWNVERSLWLAGELRSRLPGLKVWLGGPEVAADAWFATDPDAPFDLAVTGEGETSFAALLAGAAPDDIPGVWGRARPTEGGSTPLPDLSTIHDPYVAGLVTPETDGVVLAELWRGCRYRCAFCAYPQGRRGYAPAIRPADQVRDLFRWARDHDAREIYLLDPSLEQRTDLDDLLKLLAAVQGAAPIPLFAELRAEAVTPDLAERLAQAGVVMVETGLQTLTIAALKGMGRRLSPTGFAAGLKALADAGIRAKVDLMLGLPGDSPEGLDRTLDYLAEHGAIGNLQVFRTQVLPGTPLRRRALAMGVIWEQRPPYRIIETPTWAAHDLSEAMGMVEDATGEALTTLPGPLLTGPGPTPASRLRYPDSDAVLQYSWDLGSAGAASDMDREAFRGAGSWVALWIRTPNPAGDTASIVAAIRRLLAANPFVGLYVALEFPPGAPLDPLFALDDALDEDRPSRYLEGLLDAGHRPERRVGAVLRTEDRSRLPEDWLDTVRGLGEVIWHLSASGPEDAARRGKDLSLREGEYLLLNLPPNVGLPDPAVFPDPYAVLLSGTKQCWDWVERLERSAGTDF